MTVTATDLFCGAGGSSAGLHEAGIDVKMAANHWDLAIETHNSNFPEVRHDCADISQVDPRRYPRTDVLWASPSCTNHSIAKASARLQGEDKGFDGLYPPLPKEAAERSRATMWDVVRFAEYHHYKAVIVENVIDAGKWVLFGAWLSSMHALGYKHEIVYLNSAFAGRPGEGAPQSRDRMYVVFWKGTKKPDLEIRPKANCASCGWVEAVQTWKNTAGASGPRPGRYKQQYVYRCPSCKDIVSPFALPAATAIDWSIRGQRLGDRATPLAAGTMRRIQSGLDKFAANEVPMLVPVERNTDPNKHAIPVHELFPTQTARATMGLAIPPFMVEMRGGSSDARLLSEPSATVTAGGNHLYLVVPPGFVTRNNGTRGDGGEHNTGFDEPLRTLTTMGHQSVVTVPPHMLVPYYRTGVAKSVTQPMDTVTTTDRQMLVATKTDINDCEFRMLDPKEISRAMAFPETYIVKGNKRERVRQYGNAVTPPAAKELIMRVAEVLLGERLSDAA